MARAPFQVLVFLFVQRSAQGRLYAIFRRSDRDSWQAIAGGGEDSETPEQAAAREAFEEAHVVAADALIAIDSRASIPVVFFEGTDHWPRDLFVVPEYAFALEVSDASVRLSHEHAEVAWLPFEQARERLTWDSNRVALWELEQRLALRANERL